MSGNRFIFDAVRDYAETRTDHPALIFGDRVTSYGDLEVLANRVANGLSSFNLKPQSRIAILTGNTAQYTSWPQRLVRNQLWRWKSAR